MRTGIAGWVGKLRVVFVAGLTLLGAGVSPSPAATSAPAAGAIGVFEMPALVALQGLAIQQLRAGQIDAAQSVLAGLIKRYPQMPLAHYLLAALLSRQGKTAAALDRLETAIDNGLARPDRLGQDPNLAALRGDSRFQQLAKRAGGAATPPKAAPTEVSPALIVNNKAVVGEANTVWDPRAGALRVFFRHKSELPATRIVRQGKGEVVKLLNRLYSQRKSAGNHRDLYDNRDGNHSRIRPEQFRQLSFITYSQPAQKAHHHFGLNRGILFNDITLGNSSTVPRYKLSHPRVALTDPRLAARLFQQYVSNHIYVYPEDRDHDPARGDMYPANTPYLIVSQGSSGSDKPFLKAITAILAAFRRDVKDTLRANRLVMPTVQMILRRGQKSITSDADYLSGRAHPSAFEGAEIDPIKMIKLANSLSVEDIPPIVQLAVIEESLPQSGIDVFGPQSEKLFDTPAAIARVVRSSAYQNRMVVRAAPSKAGSQQALSYRWVVLCGDPMRIQIKPRRSDGSEAELIVAWHERRSIADRPELTTDRVDIGVFAHNGRHFSAPSFISFVYPARQKRDYDDQNRIVSIDYLAPEFAKRAVDMRVFYDRA